MRKSSPTTPHSLFLKKLFNVIFGLKTTFEMGDYFVNSCQWIPENIGPMLFCEMRKCPKQLI